MTPITIEPNSGVKMAGVKVINRQWHDDYVEFYTITYVGSYYFLAVDSYGKEQACLVDNKFWLLYEEPKPEVKDKIANSVYSFDGGKTWCHHGIMNYKDAEETRLSSEREGIKFIWPAKFDMDGFLIIPEEFK